MTRSPGRRCKKVDSVIFSLTNPLSMGIFWVTTGFLKGYNSLFLNELNPPIGNSVFRTAHILLNLERIV
jgi:hypothetical protein